MGYNFKTLYYCSLPNAHYITLKTKKELKLIIAQA